MKHEHKKMNISESILVLMLLWLIGGSPPVRSRNVQKLFRHQKENRFNGSNDSIVNDTTIINLHYNTTRLKLNNSVSLNKPDHMILTRSVKLDDDNNNDNCNERRSLLQIVIDTPIIYEVTVVSKSVEDKTGQYAVTFRVRKRFKEPTKRQEDKTRHIRLFFTASSDNINETSDVQTAFPSRNANECYSRALIRNNKRYIIFLRESSESEIDMSRQKFHLVSGPVQKSKSFIRSMKKYLCRNCGIKIKPMSSTNLLEGDTIKLKCSVKLKSSNQLHLFAKNRRGPFANKTLVNHNGERQRGDQNLFSRSSYQSPFYRHHSRAFVKRSHTTSMSVPNLSKKSKHDTFDIHNRKNPMRVRITWYRDGKRLSNTRKVRIRQKRYAAHNSIRSILRVRNANLADRGKFECRLRPRHESKLHRVRKTAEARREVVPKDLDQQASSRRQLKNELKYALLLNQVESNKISVVVTPFTPYIPIRKINPTDMKEIMLAKECPIDSYCLNGGTCAYYSSIGEMSCRCDVGFIGKRCERKDIYSINNHVYEKGDNLIKRRRNSLKNIRRREKSNQFTTSASHTYRCILGVTHYPC